MTRNPALFHILGLFLLVLAATMLAPVLLGVVLGWEDWHPLLIAAAVTAFSGALLHRLFPAPSADLSPREGILLTVLVWLSLGSYGSLPFQLSPAFPTLTDSVFEAVSGFTTTGATILPEVEVLGPAVQFWRHFTHWLGGMGIVLLGIAVLPLIGVGGLSLYRAEFSGARSEKLKPRLAETAVALWRIYFALTMALYLLLRIAGLDWFEAICHAFSTLGTGGFSTRTASVGGFQNPWVEIIIVVFMLLAGINFTMHYRLWRSGHLGPFFADPEIRGYLAIFALATVVVALSLLASGHSPVEALRLSAFQVASIGTTTGFATADFEKWAPLPHAVLLGLMFIGGCTGSTAGGWKVSRFLLMGKVVQRELKKTSERRGVFSIRFGGEVVPEAAIQGLLNLVYLSLVVLFVSILAVSAAGVDLFTSICSVVACMFSIGPGFGSVGPAENYAHLPALAKWILAFCMIAGRLEFYTAVVVLTPSFWKK